MATWMVHLRIADRLIDYICGLSRTEFVVGNIAPDSGIPNEDWSVFSPSADISHFKTTDTDGFKNIHLNEYVDKYYSVELRKQYDTRQKSFYLGYLTHLLADKMWADSIVRPSKDRFIELFKKNKEEWIWTLKKDWYDLDFLYIKSNPNFRAFSIYNNAIGFDNKYLSFFTKDAFDIRRNYITGFYNEKRDNLEREYPYLAEEEMDFFVDESAEKIAHIIKQEYS